MLENIERNENCKDQEGGTWMDSKDLCTESEGGYLVKISSEKENSRILEILEETGMLRKGFNFYIGLQKIKGQLVWSADKREVGYENFKQGKNCLLWLGGL